MARVAAHLPDLLFGSKVHGMLAAAGHDVQGAGASAADLLVLRPRRAQSRMAREGAALVEGLLAVDVSG
jgi:hypothetical protein